MSDKNLKTKGIKMGLTARPPGPYVVMITGLGRTDFYCYSVILLVRCCIPFFKFGEILVEGGQKRFISLNTSDSNKK